jgi:hypothetical protein
MNTEQGQPGTPSDIGAVCDDFDIAHIDAHIEKVLKGVRPLEANIALMRDLIDHGKIEAFEGWMEVYDKQPSYIHLIRNGKEGEYEQKMLEKYIRVYKMSLGMIKE